MFPHRRSDSPVWPVSPQPTMVERPQRVRLVDLATDPAPIERELDCRRGEGIEVRLLWRPQDESLWVLVDDLREGHRFRLRVRSGERALDVFHHPFAYAAHHGTPIGSGDAATLSVRRPV